MTKLRETLSAPSLRNKTVKIHLLFKLISVSLSTPVHFMYQADFYPARKCTVQGKTVEYA